MWDFFKVKTVRALKPHQCAECSNTIEVGERHTVNSGRVEGFFESYRLCLECADLASAWFHEITDEGFPLGGMRQELREEHGVTDVRAWIEASKARVAEADARHSIRRQRRARLEAITICETCGATLKTYAEECQAAAGEPCEGSAALDRVEVGKAVEFTTAALLRIADIGNG